MKTPHTAHLTLYTVHINTNLFILLSSLKFILIFTAIFICCLQINAQRYSEAPLLMTPDGKLDVVFDQFGKQYTLSDIEIKKNKKFNNSNGLQRINIGAPIVCGYYRLYFEQGCGFENGSPDVIARRNVLCQVFTDISNFIVSPLQIDGNVNTQKVNIWIRDINELVSNAATSQVLGQGSGYYNVPQFSSLSIATGGILDTEVWKTIHSGFDSFINVATPLVTPNNPLPPDASNFYHGFLSINFNLKSINWNYDLSRNIIAEYETDLYSVLLHEITHVLGFRSLIAQDGHSSFPTNYNYYSRYDTFLQYSLSNNPFIRSSGYGNFYNNYFDTLNNNSPAILQPDPNCPAVATSPLPNNTDCSNNRINFRINNGAIQIPVFRPDCFQPSSSLSHFEDEPSCFAHIPTTANDQYFVMSNGNPPSVIKRYLKPEERLALCEIGYAVNTTFGPLPTNNQLNSSINYGFNYAPSTNCSGVTVVGRNDGFIAGTSTTIAQFAYTYNIGQPALLINGFLANDVGATGAEDIQNIYSYNQNFPLSNITSTSCAFRLS